MVFILICLLDVYTGILVVRCLMSWFRPDPYNPLVRLLHQLTDPVLKPFQSMMLRSGGVGVDFSPMIVILIISLVRRALIQAVH